MSDGSNITLPHRPAAFPTSLTPTQSLPISGFLLPFSNLSRPHQNQYNTTTLAAPAFSLIEQACIPTFDDRWSEPHQPHYIALIERGSCDFATKVKAAQSRGASGVIVGDGVARLGENDEEGRNRIGLITMFSPGALLILPHISIFSCKKGRR
jgi:hypothetical protein